MNKAQLIDAIAQAADISKAAAARALDGALNGDQRIAQVQAPGNFHYRDVGGNLTSVRLCDHFAVSGSYHL